MQQLLGFAPATEEKLASAQCQDFKDFLRNELKARSGEGWFLRTIHKADQRGIEMEYDPADEFAVAKVKQASALSAGIWDNIRDGHKPRYRLLASRAPGRN